MPNGSPDWLAEHAALLVALAFAAFVVWAVLALREAAGPDDGADLSEEDIHW